MKHSLNRVGGQEYVRLYLDKCGCYGRQFDKGVEPTLYNAFKALSARETARGRYGKNLRNRIAHYIYFLYKTRGRAEMKRVLLKVFVKLEEEGLYTVAIAWHSRWDDELKYRVTLSYPYTSYSQRLTKRIKDVNGVDNA